MKGGCDGDGKDGVDGGCDADGTGKVVADGVRVVGGGDGGMNYLSNICRCCWSADERWKKKIKLHTNQMIFLVDIMWPLKNIEI